jgi:hypothetical protein
VMEGPPASVPTGLPRSFDTLCRTPAWVYRAGHASRRRAHDDQRAAGSGCHGPTAPCAFHPLASRSLTCRRSRNTWAPACCPADVPFSGHTHLFFIPRPCPTALRYVRGTGALPAHRQPSARDSPGADAILTGALS